MSTASPFGSSSEAVGTPARLPATRHHAPSCRKSIWRADDDEARLRALDRVCSSERAHLGWATVDPSQSAVRWAWQRAAQHRRSFWIGSVLLAAVVAVLTAALGEWPLAARTIPQRLINGLAVLALGVAVIVFLTFLWSLLRAPYEQRDALRIALAAASQLVDSAEARAQLATTLRELSEASSEFVGAIDRHERYPNLPWPGRDATIAALQRAISQADDVVRESLGPTDAEVMASYAHLRPELGEPECLQEEQLRAIWRDAEARVRWLRQRLDRVIRDTTAG